MLRMFLTGLALSLPVAGLAQEAPAEKPPAESAAPDAAATAAPAAEAPAAETPAAAAPAADAATAPAEPAAPAAAEAPKPAPAPQPEKPKEFLPNLYDVTVIETWDTLNVRETPDGQAKVIGKLPATAKGVELIARDPEGKWGKVNVGERSGWVALRFLKLEPGVWQPAALPQSLSCAGTEPFWSLKASKSGMVYSVPDQPERQLELRKVMDRGIEGEPTRGLIAGDDKGRVTAFIRPAQCHDGMSDRSYGLAVSVILDGADMASTMLTGCCSIAH